MGPPNSYDGAISQYYGFIVWMHAITQEYIIKNYFSISQPKLTTTQLPG